MPPREIEQLAQDHSENLGADVVDQVLLIRTDQIDRDDRLRDIDRAWATALGEVMRKEGQRTPVEVCRLPGANRWLLVAGGHRHAGAEIAEIEHVRAIVVSASRDERRLREVSENLWRRDLDPIDRAAFITELVAIHKRRAGIDPSADGRSVSAATRWQKALAAEASDASDTMSVVYGWSSDIGAQLNLSARTIERDLLLYKRLSPSLIAQLRDARHALAGNATQLRTLAKLDPARQEAVVAALLRPKAPARTISDALKAIDGVKPVAADDKRLSTFAGTFQRMGQSEKRAALQHLVKQLPADIALVTDAPSVLAAMNVAFAVIVTLVDGEAVEDEQLADAAGKLQFAIDAIRSARA